MRKCRNKMVSRCNSVATKTSDGTLSLPFGSSSKSFPLHTSSPGKLITVSQNGKYVKLQIMGWNGIYVFIRFKLVLWHCEMIKELYMSGKTFLPWHAEEPNVAKQLVWIIFTSWFGTYCIYMLLFQIWCKSQEALCKL